MRRRRHRSRGWGPATNRKKYPKDVMPPAKAGRAGTSTRRSTTGRTRGRSAAATSRSGGAWRCRRRDACSSSDAARGASRCRSRRPACRSLASIDRSRCWPAFALAFHARASRAGPRASFGVAGLPGHRPRRHPLAPVRLALVWNGALRRTGSCSRSSTTTICARRSTPSRASSSRARTFGIDLVPDVPNWREYKNKVQLRGRAAGGARLTLVESVRQDPRRRRTTFEQCYVERKGRRVRRAPLRADVPHAVGAPDDHPPRAGRLSRRRRAGRLSGPPVGRAGGCVDNDGAEVVKFAVLNSLILLGVLTCPAIQSGPRSSTRRAPLDAKRGKIFSRIIKELTVAARGGGGDPDMNPRLRTVIADAKAENMPADNIKRAIRRGTGEEPGVSYEEAQYEAYGPGGAAVIMDVLTDNKNRTVGELRHMLTKHGGNLARDQRRRLDVHQARLHRRRQEQGEGRRTDERGARRRRRRSARRRRQLGSAVVAGSVSAGARGGEEARHRARRGGDLDAAAELSEARRQGRRSRWCG